MLPAFAPDMAKTAGSGLRLAGPVALGAIGGFCGGRLCWQWFSGGVPVSRSRALAVIGMTTVTSIVIGCSIWGVVTTVAALVGLSTESGQPSPIAVVALAFYVTLLIAPLFALVLFGPIFAGLVTLWTFAWRRRLNRQATS